MYRDNANISLDKLSMYKYTFIKDNDNYYFDNITS